MMTFKMIAKAAFPVPAELFASRRFYRREMRSGERELRLLPQLVDGRIAIDVGANNGTYAYYLSKLVPRVLAFEPNPKYAWRLQNLPKNARLDAVALSDRSGTATLNIPMDRMGQELAGWATIEQRPADSLLASIEVPMRTLDSYGLNPGFIKIDVEGHEEAVVKGALATIRAAKPVLLIECEERHNAGSTQRLPALLAAEGYSGFFYERERCLPLSEFDPERHQASADMDFGKQFKRADYAFCNNFLFMPAGRRPPLNGAIGGATGHA